MPLVLLLLSLAGVAAALVVPSLAALILLAGPAAFASLILLIVALFRRRRFGRRARAGWIVVDGSNVMHWRDGTPKIATLREVIGHLSSLGYVPGIVFDANAGYKLSGRFRNDADLAREFSLSRDRVLVVSKGTQADGVILRIARELGTRVVTNDRYRDWADAHPEVAEPGHLVRGGYRADMLWINLPARR